MDSSDIVPPPSPEIVTTDPELPSCEGCRRRKLKCSRQQPTCSHCHRLGAECVYEVIRKTKPGLKTGAVEALSQRLNLVERTLAQLQGNGHHPPLPIPSSHDPTGALLAVLSNVASGLHELNAKTVARERSTLWNPIGDKRQRLNDDDPAQRHSSHVPSEMALDEPEEGDDMDTLALPKILETHGVLESLIDAYFSYIHPWISILREPTIRSRVARLGRDDNNYDNAGTKLLLHAMTYAALRFVSSAQGQGQPLAAHVVARETSRSRRTVLLTALSGLSIANLQSLLIVAFTDIGNGKCESAWPIIGSLARSAVNMGLSVETGIRGGDDGTSKGYAILGTAASLGPPPGSWVAEEESRRLFWNVFILDRFCSIVTGWNTSLTAAEVSRKLPSCGSYWYRDEPCITPYFGISDAHSAIKADMPLSPISGDQQQIRGPPSHSSILPTSFAGVGDMSKVGSLGYYVESIELLHQITAHFLHQPQPGPPWAHQKEQQQQQQQHLEDKTYLWLTRFKEVDLQLVNWKMRLPRQWRDSGVSREEPLEVRGTMDPAMTVANATHNVSIMLLHQSIAYPETTWGSECGDRKGNGSGRASRGGCPITLPRECSADTCRAAALETASILAKYLDEKREGAPLWGRPRRPVREQGRGPQQQQQHPLLPPLPLFPVSPQLGLCAFVAGRVLLVHAQYYHLDLEVGFWTLVKSLEDMGRRWRRRGRAPGATEMVEREEGGGSSFFDQLAIRLTTLERRCREDPQFRISVCTPTMGGGEENGPLGSGAADPELELDGRGRVEEEGEKADGRVLYASARCHQEHQQHAGGGDSIGPSAGMQVPPPFAVARPTLSDAAAASWDSALEGSSQNNSHQLAVLSQDMMDKSFTELDRIISSDEFMLFTDMTDFFPDQVGG